MRHISLGTARIVGVILLVPASSMAQYKGEAVYGRCAVQAEGWHDNFGQCRITGTEDGSVPAGKQLVIEHVSAVCSGPVEHQITVLAVGVSLKPEQDMSTQMTIPLARRELSTRRSSLYEASFRTKLYAGPGTKVELYLGLEEGFLPTTSASCGVMFHGRLQTEPQKESVITPERSAR